eukprot:1159156-Pelagomonas_calceolata.AAC.2
MRAVKANPDGNSYAMSMLLGSGGSIQEPDIDPGLHKVGLVSRGSWMQAASRSNNFAALMRSLFIMHPSFCHIMPGMQQISETI